MQLVVIGVDAFNLFHAVMFDRMASYEQCVTSLSPRVRPFSIAVTARSSLRPLRATEPQPDLGARPSSYVLRIRSGKGEAYPLAASQSGSQVLRDAADPTQ